MAAARAAGEQALKSMDSLPGVGAMFLCAARNQLTQRLMDLGVLHPRMFKMWAGRPVVIGSHPEVARQILTRPQDFEKTHFTPTSKYVEPLRKHLDMGTLVFDNGDEWASLRKPLDPAFEKKALAALMPKFCETSQQLVDKWSVGGVQDAKQDMSRFALDVLGTAMLGRSFSALDGQLDDTYRHYQTVMAELMNPLYAAFPSLELLPLARNRSYKEGLLHMRGVLQQAVDERLEQRRNAAGGESAEFAPQDMLDMILGPGVDAKGVIPEDKLLEVLWLMFIAGHDTTAIALTWMMQFLADHPEVQTRAREEALAVMNGAKDPSAEMLEQVPYISAMINECLRLRPPVFNQLSRIAKEDTELDGFLVPKGTAVSIMIGSVNRHPDAYDNPDVFMPERFLEKKQKGVKGPRVFNFLPFSAGPRRCLGDKFSLMEQKTLLMKLLTTCEVLPAGSSSDFDNQSVPILLMQPKEMKVEIRPFA